MHEITGIFVVVLDFPIFVFVLRQIVSQARLDLTLEANLEARLASGSLSLCLCFSQATATYLASSARLVSIFVEVFRLIPDHSSLAGVVKIPVTWTQKRRCLNGGEEGYRDDVMGAPWAPWPLATLGHIVGISALFSEVLGHLSLPGFWSLEKGTHDRTCNRSLVSASHCCIC